MKEKEQNFEEALKTLEEIVESLESGELSLTEALKKYEEGMKLSQVCTKKLHDIKKKIEVLVKDSSGNISAQDFQPDVVGKPKDKKTKKDKKPTPGGRQAEEFLF